MALAFALLLAACTSTPDNRQVTLQLPKQAEMQPAAEREHQRILASYGGVYEDAKLNEEISALVDRLVAASERPDLKYEVTILNSPAINAFALPNGQLYVTRGLIALANDKAELASVLSHEMAHVIARHAQIRAEQARQAALVGHVFSDVVSDPQMGALALAKSKLTLASFSRAQEFEADGIGVGIAARAGFDPYGAARFLTDMEHYAALKSASRRYRPARARFSLHASGDARAGEERARQRPPVQRPRHRRARPRRLSRQRRRHGLWRGPERRLRARPPLPASQARLHLPGAARLHARQHRAGGARLEGRRRPRRCGSMSSACRPNRRWPTISNPAGSSTSMRRACRTSPSTDFRRRPRPPRAMHWSFRLFAVRFGSDVYRFIYAAKTMTPEVDRSFRESIETFRRMSLKEAAEVKPLHLKVVSVGANDTVETLARRMAIGDHRLDRFRVLNGLGGRTTR